MTPKPLKTKSTPVQILDPKQNKLVQKIATYLLNPANGKPLVVDSISGSGKTTIMAHGYVSYLKGMEMQNTLSGIATEPLVVIPTATVNKVIPDLVRSFRTHKTMPIDRVYLIDSRQFSIYKVLNLVPDMNTGKLKYKQHAILSFPSENTVVVIDEASIINEDLHSYIKTHLLNRGIHVILLGDQHQLLGVGEKESYIYSKYKKTHALSKCYRGNDPAFSKYVAELKKNVSLNKIPRIPKRVGNIVEKMKTDKFHIALLEHAIKYSKTTAYITYTNKRADTIEIYLKDLKLSVTTGTVHKAQGQTIDYVFLDIRDGVLERVNDVNTIARFLYVAISRANKKVYILE